MDHTHGEYEISEKQERYYTPTTEEIRLDYAPAKTFPADAEAQFDRWLAEVKAQAWEQGATTIVATIVMNGSNDMPRNPYRQGEGSGNGASQSPVESSNLLNGEEQ